MKAWVIKRRHDGLYKSIKPCLWENEIYKARCYETEATALKALKLSAYVGDDYTTYYSIIPINISEGDIEEAENLFLKLRWEKLQGWLNSQYHEHWEEYRNTNDWQYRYFCEFNNKIIDKMQELEQEDGDDN